MKYVVYEIWTRATIVDATDEHDAYSKGEPEPREDLNLANWHVVPIDQPMKFEVTGALNFRQV
jgi:hypothetical protein